MTNPRLEITEEHNTSNKRKRVLAAVTQDLVTSEDDDNVADGMDICDIIENHTNQHRQTATSNALHALGETIRNTLLEINEIREQNRERRHRELLEVLTKMVQHENSNKIEITSPKFTNLKDNKSLNNVNKQNFTEMDILKKQQLSLNTNEDITQDIFSNSKETLSNPVNNQQTTILSINSSTSEMLTNNSNINVNETAQPIRMASSFNKTPNKYIKLLPNSPVSTSSNQPQLTKIQNVVSVRSANIKEELQKMRAQMLELQRQKMEDRERKKRELLQMQNM